MRDPARKALYWLLALVAGAGLVRFGIGRELRVGEDLTSVGPLVLGLAISPFALVFLVQALLAARGRAKLLAGTDVIARWRIDPLEWERFRALDRRRLAEQSPVGNDMRIRKAKPFGPVEVIVGEKSALIDGSYHPLRPRGLPELRSVGWIEGPPACLEFRLHYPRRSGGSLPTILRIPAPASARPAALRVYAHFERLARRSPPLALRNPPRTYRICAFLVLGAASSAVAGYALARARPDGADPLLALGLLIGGTFLAIFAATLAFATFLATRRT